MVRIESPLHKGGGWEGLTFFKLVEMGGLKKSAKKREDKAKWWGVV